MSESEYHKAITAIGQALQSVRPLWEVEPFFLKESPWKYSYREMHDALTALSDNEVSQLLQEESLCQQWLANYFPALFTKLQKWQPAVAHRPTATQQLDIQYQPISNGIPGRKWMQIKAFTQAMASLPVVLRSADWCSGKGYLANYLSAFTGSEVDCLEINEELCHEGQYRARQFSLPINFHKQDVLKPINGHVLACNERHVALHACGELHRSLWRQTIGIAEQVCLSPCCYHLGASSNTQFSVAARKSGLKLNAKELRIPLLETVTGGRKALKQRGTEQCWRLAYEHWRAIHTGNDQYQPLTSISKGIFNGPPLEFFNWAAKQHGLTFEPEKLEQVLKMGEKRFAMTERLGIVRQGLKRFLEYFIVLDLACYAEEKGYQVNIVEFCDKSITPRNIAILAINN